MTPAKATSILLVALVSLTLLNFILKYYTYFVLVVAAHKSGDDLVTEDPGEVPHPHELFVPFLTFIPTRSPVLSRPWVLVTSSFVQESFIGSAPSILVFFYLGSFLEAKWGASEFVCFVMTVVLLSNTAVYCWYWIKKILGSSSVPPVVISSLAIIMALLVATKQRIANHYMILFRGSVRIKVTYLPFLLLVSTMLASLLWEDFRILVLLAITGWASSWTYLRYFKLASNERQSYMLPYANKRSKADSTGLAFEDSTLRGDRSELFALHTFFPGPLALIVKVCSNVVFHFMVKHHYLDPKDYAGPEDDGENEDINSLQSKLFSLSLLKGAGDVSPLKSSKLSSMWAWISQPKREGIKTSMDKRRMLAIRELE